MRQEIEQTHDEKVKMYMKSSKLELVKMLISCNNNLSPPRCYHEYETLIFDGVDSYGKCKKCGHALY